MANEKFQKIEKCRGILRTALIAVDHDYDLFIKSIYWMMMNESLILLTKGAETRGESQLWLDRAVKLLEKLERGELLA